MTQKPLPSFFLDSTKLFKIANARRDEFAAAKPFPHIAIDNFLPNEIAMRLFREFEAHDQRDWDLWGPGRARHSENPEIEKTGTSREEYFSPLTRFIMLQFNSQTFIRFLEQITGHTGLLGDPYYNGCGLHSTGRGGSLMIHIDSNRYPIKTPRIHQILNCIFFVNHGWKESYGGHFELWDAKGKNCVSKVLPKFNRLLIFETGTQSYHGHPEPLTCPVGRRRNSLAAYFYKIDRPLGGSYAGFQKQVTWLPRTAEESRLILRHRIIDGMNRFVPPIIFDVKDAVTNWLARKRAIK